MLSTLRRLALVAAAATAAACGPDDPQVEIQTPLGNVRVELHAQRAPRTVANFLRYVDQGRFQDASFYRVRRDEQQLLRRPTGLVQGGLWRGDSTRLLPPIPLESTRQTGLRHVHGTVSMARFGDASSARAEFFVVLGTQPHLDFRDADDPGFAAFGTVVEGIEVVEAIQARRAEGEILRRPVPFRVIRVP